MAALLLTVRALATAGEREQHCQFEDQAFSRAPSLASARNWYQFVTTTPGYRPEQFRGAFRDGEQVGSYMLEERTMHVGTARLLTGCIGAVVTYPDHRHQGVATALMHAGNNPWRIGREPSLSWLVKTRVRCASIARNCNSSSRLRAPPWCGCPRNASRSSCSGIVQLP